MRKQSLTVVLTSLAVAASGFIIASPTAVSATTVGRVTSLSGCVSVANIPRDNYMEVALDPSAGFNESPGGLWKSTNAGNLRQVAPQPSILDVGYGNGPFLATTFDSSDFGTVSGASVPYSSDDNDIWLSVDGWPTADTAPSTLWEVLPQIPKADAYFDAVTVQEREAALAAQPPVRPNGNYIPRIVSFEVVNDRSGALAITSLPIDGTRRLWLVKPGAAPVELAGFGTASTSIESAGDQVFFGAAPSGTASLYLVDVDASGAGAVEVPHQLPPSASYSIGDATADGRYLSVSVAAAWYRVDTATGATVPLSVSPSGQLMVNQASTGDLSDDGNLFSFAEQTAGGSVIRNQYVRDIAAGTTTTLVASATSLSGSGVSTDGRFVYSSSTAGTRFYDRLMHSYSTTHLQFAAQGEQVGYIDGSYFAPAFMPASSSNSIELMQFDHPSSCVTALRVAILGDSYISGEGTGDFISGTDVEADELFPGSRTNKCHRSTSSWAYKAALELSGGDANKIVFLACSGATTAELFQDNTDNNESAQLDMLAAAHDQIPIDVVLVSVGGNDAGFADLVKACLIPFASSCASSHWLDPFAEHHPYQVSQALKSIKNVTDGAAVYQMGYPDPVRPTGSCAAASLTISEAEQAWISSTFLPALNASVKRATADAGVTFIDASDAFDGYGLCSEVRAANGPRLGNDTGPLGLRVAEADSYHPTKFGYQLLAERFRSIARPGTTAILQPNAPPVNQNLTADPFAATRVTFQRVDDGSDPAVISWNTPLRITIQLGPNGAQQEVELTAFSLPVRLATVVTDVNGNAGIDVAIPVGLAPGEHVLEVTVGGALIAGTTFQVSVDASCLSGTDNDGDGVNDSCDPSSLDGPNADPDRDGINNADDNCPLVSNPGQEPGTLGGTLGAACEAGTDGVSVKLNTELQLSDVTPPTVTATANPVANHAGWNNTAVTVTFECADLVSKIVDCTPAATVTGEGASQAVLGEGTDEAGNTQTASVSVSIDLTAPVVVLDAPTDGSSVLDGGYVPPSCDAFDDLSGLDGVCTVTVTEPVVGVGLLTYTASASASDRAGNTASLSSTYSVIVDVSAPSIVATPDRPANADNWYSGPVAFTFECSDPSGISSCPSPLVLGAEGDNQSLTVSASDLYGNTGHLTVSGINVDATDPALSRSVSPSPNGYGWHKSSVTLSASCVDSLSGVAACSAPVTVENEGADQTLMFMASDLAGNTATTAVAVSLDLTGPTVHLNAPADGSSVGISSYVEPTCQASDGLSGLNGVCTVTLSESVSGTGVLSYTASASVADKAGNVTTVVSTYSVIVDVDAPSIVATPDRPANENGWYADPVTFTFECSDPSGIGDCPAPVNVSSQGDNQSFTVTASDVYGNTGQLTVSAVNIDSTPPTVSASAPTIVYPVDSVSVACSASDALSGLDTVSCTSSTFPALDLQPGTNLLTFSATDRAGNITTVTKTVTLSITSASIRNLIRTYVGSGPGANGIVTSLSTKLSSGNVTAFINEIEGQCCSPSKNKRFTRDQADTLIHLVQ